MVVSKSALGGTPTSGWTFAGVLTASIVLWVAILRHDFRFEQVADHSSRSLPTVYQFSSFWSSQAGSLLLWGLVL